MMHEQWVSLLGFLLLGRQTLVRACVRACVRVCVCVCVGSVPPSESIPVSTAWTGQRTGGSVQAVLFLLLPDPCLLQQGLLANCEFSK